MQTRVLVAYASSAGTTGKVAEAIGKELAAPESDSTEGAAATLEVDVRPIREVKDLGAYQAVVVGGPMIMGWHREAAGFVKRHRDSLGLVPVAYFFTAMSLTRVTARTPGDVPVFEDPALAKAPSNPERLSFKERYATVANYLKPALAAAPGVRPVSAAFFAGKLDLTRLNIFQQLFVLVVVGAQPGDRRNWIAIRAWAAGLRPQLAGPSPRAAK